ncbi:leucine-rich repeat flightless-interacting protein 1 [Talpa occidentalis]|uniref:leucine-rich repeat flightless-interacting protein 1 n=1 Tax=Talpa occidentalis TaxID=50954 RepID=UPI0023F79306|nr:leucine-rich repeat flightless-interacting protein 1 [Talpa occidentalis]
MTAEARLAAKRAARAEAREIRMKELERQQKEEDSERCSRRPRRSTSASDEDERASVGSRGSRRTNGYDGDLQAPSRRSGRPSEHGGHLNSSSRASSRASSARASPVVEERPEKDFTEKGPRSLPGLSAAALASLGGTSSRRGSGDTSLSVDTEASLREMKELSELKDQIQDVEGKYMQGLKEMKDSLAEAEEKYRKAMVSNAQLDNEKTLFMYQVDTLKDTLLELEEQLAESRRQCEEKGKEFERERHAHSVLQFQFAEVKEALRQREEMLEALERQKEFFDSVRSERDDLREEVVTLKEALKKHGIIFNPEVAANGETPHALNSTGLAAPTKMTKEELNALTATGPGALGKANVGKGEILQNTEQEQHKEDPRQASMLDRGLHAGSQAEHPRASGDSAPTPGAAVDAPRGGPVPESVCLPERVGQAGSGEATGTLGADPGAAAQRPRGLSESDSEAPGPVTPQGSHQAPNIKLQRDESSGERDHGEQDLNGSQGAASVQAGLEAASQQGPGAGCEKPSAGRAEAQGTGFGQRVDAEASGAPEDRAGPVPCGEELAPSTGLGVVEERADQEAAEPEAGPVQSSEGGREGGKGEDEDGEPRAERPVPGEGQAAPGSPSAASRPEAAGADPDPQERRGEEKALEASPKKAKNRKKKNKKKKPPAPLEPPKDAEEELTSQSADFSEEKEEQAPPTGGESAEEAQDEAAESPGQGIATGSSRHVGCPENPTEPAGAPRQEEDGADARAGGDASATADSSVPPAGPCAADEAVQGGVREDLGDQDGSPRSRAAAPGVGEEAGSGQQDHGSPVRGRQDAAPAESTEGPVAPGCPSQGAEKGLESDALAPDGELGDLDAESTGGTSAGGGTGRGKEDCALPRPPSGHQRPLFHDIPSGSSSGLPATLAELLPSPVCGLIRCDIRLKKLVEEREHLLEQVRKLKGQLEEGQKNSQPHRALPGEAVLENGTDVHVVDLQRDANRQISDLKFKLAKSEQEIAALEQNVMRLESQVSRYKSAAESAEKIEDELKAEKRKLQRELRSALDKTEELEVSNGHLVKRLEKMKANRSALLSQQ